MYQDFSGFWHESKPGEFMEMMNNGRRWPPNNQGQQAPAQAPQQTQNVKQAQNFQHLTFDIIFVSKREDTDLFDVKPGLDQIFCAEDESWLAVKTAVGNSSKTTFYQKEPEKPAQQAVDMSVFARRDEIPGLVSAAILEITKQQEGTNNGTS